MFSGIGTGEKGIEQAFGISCGRSTSELHLNRSESGQSITARESGQPKISGDNSWTRVVPQCVGFSEIDRHAEAIYKYHYPDHRNYGDATGIICDELPDFDFLIGGFPCQAFSIAGKRQGFDDARGTLFFEIARILSHKRPAHFLLENVRGLLSSRSFIPRDLAYPILHKEILPLIWAKDVTPTNNYNSLTENLAAYLSEILPMSWVFPNMELGISSTIASKKNSELLARNLESGLQKRLQYLAIQLSPTERKRSDFPIELPNLSQHNGDEWDLSRVLASLSENLQVLDTTTLTQTVGMLGDAALLSKENWADALHPMRWYTTLTETRRMTAPQTSLYALEASILVFTIKQWRLSNNFWKQVRSNLIANPGNTFYVKTFNLIISILSDIGYCVEWTCLNSKDYGVPQNRERCFFIGHLRERCRREILSIGNGDGEPFTEPDGSGYNVAHTITNGDKQRGSYVIASTDELAWALDANYYKGSGAVEKARRTVNDGSTGQKVSVGTLRTHKNGNGFREVQSGNCPTIPARAREDGSGQPVIAVASRGLPRDGRNEQQLEPRFDGLTNTITSVEKDNLIANDRRIRRLTPRECEALQGLPPDYTKFGRYGDEIKEVSDTQRYKGLGNSFTVNVIEAIITRMLEKGCIE